MQCTRLREMKYFVGGLKKKWRQQYEKRKCLDHYCISNGCVGNNRSQLQKHKTKTKP